MHGKGTKQNLGPSIKVILPLSLFLYIYCWQCSVTLFWNRSRDCCVYTTSEDRLSCLLNRKNQTSPLTRINLSFSPASSQFGIPSQGYPPYPTEQCYINSAGESCAVGDVRALVPPRKEEWSLSGEPRANGNTLLLSFYL